MFQGLLLVIVVMIDGSENVIRISWLLNFIVRVLRMVLNCANGTKPTTDTSSHLNFSIP